jgi:hypothetical protein
VEARRRGLGFAEIVVCIFEMGASLALTDDDGLRAVFTAARLAPVDLHGAFLAACARSSCDEAQSIGSPPAWHKRLGDWIAAHEAEPAAQSLASFCERWDRWVSCR